MGKSPRLKQATISSLKGVVVYEEILRHKGILESKYETSDSLMKSLTYLQSKKPSKEALITTDICTAVQTACEHENINVANKAQELLKMWQDTLNSPKDSQPTIEVRYDLSTQHFRNTSEKLFLKELGDSEECKKLAKMLEKEIFYRSNRLLKATYRRTVRKVVFVLRHNEEEKDNLTKGQISAVDFVSKYRRL